MKRHRHDKNGIPIVSRADLEDWAERFLSYFDQHCLKEPMPAPLGKITTELQDKHGVCFAFNQDLGLTRQGYKILGQFHIPTTSILIDRSIGMEDPRFTFTLSHEISHFVLHRRISTAVIGGETEPSISDTKRHLILYRVRSQNPRDWIEWQANKFASSFLLPRFTVAMALQRTQEALGITRSVGRIELDGQRGNRQDFRHIMDSLQGIFHVSRAAIRIRLRELNLLVEQGVAGQRPVAHIREAMASWLTDWSAAKET